MEHCHSTEYHQHHRHRKNFNMDNKTQHASVIFGTRFPNRLFVGCLPENATAIELGAYFQQYGRVLEAKVLIDNYGRSKKYGFVSFIDEGSVSRVLAEQPIVFMGKVINVAAAVKKDRQEWSQRMSQHRNEEAARVNADNAELKRAAQRMPTEMKMTVQHQPPVTLKPYLHHIYSIPNYFPAPAMNYSAMNYSANNIYGPYQSIAHTNDYTKYNPLMINY